MPMAVDVDPLLHDPLTGLPNRRLLEDRIEIAAAQAQRLERPIAVLRLDLDRFKPVNDVRGPRVGDEILRRIARRLASSILEGDTVARTGGDEFTVLLPDVRHEEDAAKVAESLRRAVAAPVFVEGEREPVRLTATLGVAIFPADGHDAESLLRNAENALHRAKALGGDSYQLCTPEMNRRAAERLKLEEDLRAALAREEIHVRYQPIYRLKDGSLSGFEALARWTRSGGREVPAEVFVSLAEEARLILPIGRFVLLAACREAARWKGRGAGPTVAVNLSAWQLREPRIADEVARVLDETRLAPSRLMLEITERVAVQDAELTARVLAQLRGMGVYIALDDFGIGYSSLAYLHRFPVDALKIDRTFVQELRPGSRGGSIVAAIIALGHALQLKIIAEGVETDEQAAFLRAHGCDEAQGYRWSGPLATPDVNALVEEATV
ncbi:MAG TPA: EAL domain-containing protein [Thermoanaerobaculia bacterium]|jgi:diguanylate cyclase (GGDEF)-like protein